MKKSKIKLLLAENIPPQMFEFIQDIGIEADSAGVDVYLAGGFVRDLLLGRKNYDLDIVVEGDAINFGRIMKRCFGGKLATYKKFGTATLTTERPEWLDTCRTDNKKFRIDIAVAREEWYPEPAALPVVTPGTLHNDLKRRDFTINAMALKLNSNDFADFIDIYGGEKDLGAKLIRVMHDTSFVDDPTRIFRAIRFEQRLGFTIEKHTLSLMRTAVNAGVIEKTEDYRIREEMRLIHQEDDPQINISRMNELSIGGYNDR